jgi:rRNA maturation RNase YbeY
MVTVKNRHKEDLPVLEICEKLKVIAGHKKAVKRVYFYLVDNQTIQDLNARFLGKDKPTNVISFPSDDKTMIGEVFVSVDYCIAEIEETDLTVAQLLVFYCIHGFLHLLGYEHTLGGNKEKEMLEEERGLFKIVFPEIDLDYDA